MRPAALLIACLLALSAPDARADYLNTPGELVRGWALLAPRIAPGAALSSVQVQAGDIAVEWPGAPPRGGIEAVILRAPGAGGKPAERVEGPAWAAGDPLSGRVAFALADLVAPEALEGWLARARIAVKLGAEVAVARLEVSHPADAGLTYAVTLDTPGHLAEVGMDSAGRIVWLRVGSQAALALPVAATAAPPPEIPPEPAPPPEPWRGDSGRDLVAGLAALAAHLGPDTRIWEVDARPDRITIDRPHPTQPRTTAILTLTERGIGTERTFPQMMQTDADLFPLSALAALTPESVEAARATGLAGVALPGGQVARLRIWSGAPFWRHPAGEPFFDIRVEVPPGHQNGYGVVTLGGQLVEAFR
jgi:hypothetical protein